MPRARNTGRRSIKDKENRKKEGVRRCPTCGSILKFGRRVKSSFKVRKRR